MSFLPKHSVSFLHDKHNGDDLIVPFWIATYSFQGGKRSNLNMNGCTGCSSGQYLS